MVYDNIHILTVANYDLYDEHRKAAYLNIKDNEMSKDEIEQIWENIKDQIIDYGGIDSTIIDTVILENEWLILQIDLLRTGDRTLKNQINQIERELEQIKKGQEVKRITMTKRLSIVATILGMFIPAASSTVAEFMDYTERANEVLKLRQKQAKNDY